MKSPGLLEVSSLLSTSDRGNFDLFCEVSVRKVNDTHKKDFILEFSSFYRKALPNCAVSLKLQIVRISLCFLCNEREILTKKMY